MSRETYGNALLEHVDVLCRRGALGKLRLERRDARRGRREVGTRRVALGAHSLEVALETRTLVVGALLGHTLRLVRGVQRRLVLVVRFGERCVLCFELREAVGRVPGVGVLAGRRVGLGRRLG